MVIDYLSCIEFCRYLFPDWKEITFCRNLILQFGDCKTFHGYLILQFQQK